jgi:uracil-DNA glycosylase
MENISPTAIMNGTWNSELFIKEAAKPYLSTLKAFIAKERLSYTVLPEQEHVLRAFDLTPPNKVKVIIVGQDPYYTKGHSNGLAFSCIKKDFIPPSLEIIFREVYKVYGIPFVKADIKSCDLTPWAEQGVFLLNRILTVRENKALSHKQKGWEKFTSEAIKILAKDFRPKVFMLWGSEAQKLSSYIDRTKHLVLSAPHPTAHLFNSRTKTEFPGCDHFTKANNFLKEKGISPINWILS